ncbi:MAG: hypothetical protein OQK98_13745 [Gammaproteobacteria bacterium]|nr:hypothetical protein [Gammaproteobacteria bacterium]
MIPYSHSDEKNTILAYAELFNDKTTQKIIENDSIQSNEEAIHLAYFFWDMARESNKLDKEKNTNSEFILEKIINTLMAYYRTSGYEQQWEEVADKQ